MGPEVVVVSRVQLRGVGHSRESRRGSHKRRPVKNKWQLTWSLFGHGHGRIDGWAAQWGSTLLGRTDELALGPSSPLDRVPASEVSA